MFFSPYDFAVCPLYFLCLFPSPSDRRNTEHRRCDCVPPVRILRVPYWVQAPILPFIPPTSQCRATYPIRLHIAVPTQCLTRIAHFFFSALLPSGASSTVTLGGSLSAECSLVSSSSSHQHLRLPSLSRTTPLTAPRSSRALTLSAQ